MTTGDDEQLTRAFFPLFDTWFDGVVYVYSLVEDRFLYASSSYRRFYGLDEDEMYAPGGIRRLWHDVHPDDRQAAFDALHEGVRNGEPVEVELRITESSRDPWWAYTRIFPIRDDDGEIRHFGGLVQDITERKAEQAHVDEMRREAEEVLRAARDEAEQANLAKTDFLAKLSHELRTPLTAVIGFADLLALDPLTSEQRDAVERIATAGAHMERLLSEILDVARIEVGGLGLSMQPVPVGATVAEAVELTQPLAASRDIAVRAPGVSTGGPWALADRSRVVQVVLNLLSNAIEYNRPGGAVEVRVEVPDDAMVRIDVEDTGVGIPEDAAPTVFEPFRRLAGTAGTRGTGLGLALCKTLIEAMGGTIEPAFCCR